MGAKPDDIITKVQEMPKSEWRAWLKNIYKFTAPALAVLFTQLALGVDWKAAGLVALYILYGLLADLFKKANDA